MDHNTIPICFISPQGSFSVCVCVYFFAFLAHAKESLHTHNASSIIQTKSTTIDQFYWPLNTFIKKNVYKKVADHSRHDYHAVHLVIEVYKMQFSTHKKHNVFSFVQAFTPFSLSPSKPLIYWHWWHCSQNRNLHISSLTICFYYKLLVFVFQCSACIAFVFYLSVIRMESCWLIGDTDYIHCPWFQIREKGPDWCHCNLLTYSLNKKRHHFQ